MNLESKLKVAVMGITLAALTACSDEEKALNAAHSAGWGKDTTVTSSSYIFDFTCAESEMAYEISGKNAAGKPATATVCCGYMTLSKGCTIRYE